VSTPSSFPHLYVTRWWAVQVACAVEEVPSPAAAGHPTRTSTTLLSLSLELYSVQLVEGALGALSALLGDGSVCRPPTAEAPSGGGRFLGLPGLAVEDVQRALRQHPLEAYRALGQLWQLVPGAVRVERRQLNGELLTRGGGRKPYDWVWDRQGPSPTRVG
jgi:hypothetical protein